MSDLHQKNVYFKDTSEDQDTFQVSVYGHYTSHTFQFLNKITTFRIIS